MPTNTINVTLNKRVLDVDDHGAINVPKNPQPTKIVWVLTGELANASFAAMDGTDPGFQWEEPPPAGIFTAAELTTNDKRIEIVDNHNDNNNSKGEWIYKLRVIYKNTIYTTTSKYDRVATSNNPVIINKDP